MPNKERFDALTSWCVPIGKRKQSLPAVEASLKKIWWQRQSPQSATKTNLHVNSNAESKIDSRRAGNDLINIHSEIQAQQRTR